MEQKADVMCCGCLCSERKLKPLDDDAKRQCFLQIINEIPMTVPDNDLLTACWECDALISRFIKFKRQVKTCYKALNEYSKQNTNLMQQSHFPNLSMHIVLDLDIDPNINSGEQVTIDVYHPKLKVENSIKSEIKDEDNESTHSDNLEDNTFLIEFSRKKKRKVKERKRKKEKNDEVVREIELTVEELAEERRTLAEREDYVIAMFRCENCIVSFPNIDDLNDHQKLKHDANKSKFKCNICECTFATDVSYNYHTNRHVKRFQCTVCDVLFNSKRAATKHYEVTHMLMSYQLNGDTSYCENGDSETKTLKQEFNESPKQEAVSTATFPCEFCNKTFRWKTSLRKHSETHRIETGQKRKPYCEPCRLSFTTTSNLQKHVKTSSKHQIQLKLWKLKESHLDVVNSVEQIARSVNNARRQFPCSHCGRSFQWRGNLRRHLRSHRARANGELVCEPCNRTFSSIATYKQHMKISKKHVSESDFKYMCSDCGKRFANKTRLKDHVDWEHLKNFVHTCSTCQKVFKSHTSLYLHKQVVHKKDNAEHLCDHCGKHFPNRPKLRSHQLALHSGSAPYGCPSCPARFTWRSCLSRHARRVHNAHNATT
ncbi:unnamed protein product [Chilo suppressalis]|uniref:C2H2-type domain-containing protein n=1 Tax=Chilo suppressalis TaxID=168631 RepID=A0ABN8BBI1_CHISP|nr:unnamed protein product [Chilo suppressalis]